MTKDEKYKYATWLAVDHLVDGIEYLSVHEQYDDYCDVMGVEPVERGEDDVNVDEDFKDVHDMVNAMLFAIAHAIGNEGDPSPE